MNRLLLRRTAIAFLGSSLLCQAVDLFSPGDPILGGRINGDFFEIGVAGTAAGINNWPAGEAPGNAINGAGQKYLNFAEFNTGVVVTPMIGESNANALKLWTANDSEARDPASFELYGSNAPLEPGPLPMANFTLIASGSLSLPSTRNAGGAAALDDANSQRVEILGNTEVYTTYLIVFPTVKDAASANSMQIAEIQLEGILGSPEDTDGDGLPDAWEIAHGLDPNDNGLNPNNNGVPGDPSQGADGDPDGDGLTNLQELNLGTDPQNSDTDGDSLPDNVENNTGVWMGPTATGTDPLNPDTDGDGLPDGLEIAAGLNPTVPALALFVPGDPILGGQVINSEFVVGMVGGDADGNAWPAVEAPVFAIDGAGQKYLNFGNLNTGVLVTPSAGPSVAFAMTLWTANDATERDPTTYELYGSNDDIAGQGPFPLAQFSLISSGDLTPPASRNPGGAAPLETANSYSVLFSNSVSYTSYLIIFPTIRNNATADSMQIAEVQLLGRLGASDAFALDIQNSGDDLLFTFNSRAGRLYDILSSTDPVSEPDPSAWAVWQADLPATPPQNVETFARPADPERFFVVREREAPPFFSDDFESGQGAWTTGVSDAFGNTQWMLGTPVGPLPGPTSGADGSANAFSTNLGAYGINSDIFLRSPVLDLTAPGLAGATLHMDHFRDADGFADTGTIRVLRAGDLMQLGTSIDAGLTALDLDWSAFSTPLPPEALGEMVVLEFRFTSDSSPDSFSGWSIDNVEVKLE